MPFTAYLAHFLFNLQIKKYLRKAFLPEWTKQNACNHPYFLYKHLFCMENTFW